MSHFKYVNEHTNGSLTTNICHISIVPDRHLFSCPTLKRTKGQASEVISWIENLKTRQTF